MARRRNKGEEKQTARRRIDRLLQQARREALGPDADLADRYAALGLALSRRYQAPLRPAAKVQVCRRCGAYRRPQTTRVRIHRGRLITTCLRCHEVRRRPLTTAAGAGHDGPHADAADAQATSRRPRHRREETGGPGSARKPS